MYNYPNYYAPTYNFCPCCGRPTGQGQYAGTLGTPVVTGFAVGGGGNGSAS